MLADVSGRAYRSDGNAILPPVIEHSADLKTWQALASAVEGIGLDGHPVWLDASATDAATRYYRAVAP